MAYHSIQGLAHGRLDLLNQLRTFLVTTTGWTLHDDQLADPQPYFVFKSHGESGAEDVYLQFRISTTSGRIHVAAFQYWIAATHTGVNEASHTSYTYLRVEDSADFIFWLFADLDHVFVVTKLVSTYYGHYSGLLKRFWSGAIALTQAAVTAGSGVVLQVNDATVVTPGQDYVIKDDAGIERVRVSAIDTAVTPNTITVETLVRDYASGAKIGEDPQPVVNSYYNAPGTFYAVNKFDGWTPGRNRSRDALRHHHPLSLARLDVRLRRLPGTAWRTHRDLRRGRRQRRLGRHHSDRNGQLPRVQPDHRRLVRGEGVTPWQRIAESSNSSPRSPASDARKRSCP
jgi:hypothetical protein